METTAIASASLRCKDCGAALEYEIGTHKLQCKYCGAENEIATATDTSVHSFDYNEFIAGNIASEDQRTETVVQCSSCGATVDLPAGVTSDNCPFCATPLVTSTATSTKVLKPHYVLPFVVDSKKAFGMFQGWMKGLWFAPSDLVKRASDISSRQLQGIYLPHWSYDTDTVTHYTGERGEHYTETETYEEEEDGETVTHEREVQHTEWYPASGTVSLDFKDVLVSASPSLPQKIADKLKPWKLDLLQPFDESYLSGFRSETYRITAEQGFDVAKQEMDATIRGAIMRDIGGDEQRIMHYENTYLDTALKYVTLPVWLSAYRYNDKVYHFYINACTGEVQGERPYSTWKIVFAILLGIALIAGFILLVQSQ